MATNGEYREVMMKLPWDEDFAQFFENPSRSKLRDLLKNLAELDQLDFKESWPSYPKVAKHVLAMANSNGGCIVIGVAERDDKTLDSVGVDTLADEAQARGAIERFLPRQVKFHIRPFHYEDSDYQKLIGKKFQVIVVDNQPQYLPFISMSESGNEIKKDAIYVRKSTKSVVANYDDLQELINRRLATKYSTEGERNLEQHLGDLRVLYSQIERVVVDENYLHYSEIPPLGFKKNRYYPLEDYNAFIGRMIDEKKKIILSVLSR